MLVSYMSIHIPRPNTSKLLLQRTPGAIYIYPLQHIILFSTYVFNQTPHQSLSKQNKNKGGGTANKTNNGDGFMQRKPLDTNRSLSIYTEPDSRVDASIYHDDNDGYGRRANKQKKQKHMRVTPRHARHASYDAQLEENVPAHCQEDGDKSSCEHHSRVCEHE